MTFYWVGVCKHAFTYCMCTFVCAWLVHLLLTCQDCERERCRETENEQPCQCACILEVCVCVCVCTSPLKCHHADRWGLTRPGGLICPLSFMESPKIIVPPRYLTFSYPISIMGSWGTTSSSDAHTYTQRLGDKG